MADPVAMAMLYLRAALDPMGYAEGIWRELYPPWAADCEPTEFEMLEMLGASENDREKHRENCRKCMKHMIVTCEELGLGSSQAPVSHAYDDLPQTKREFDLLLRAVMAEVNKTFFLFVPGHVSKYYEWAAIVSDGVIDAFPKASQEIRHGGTCLAAGLHTASVFHAMPNSTSTKDADLHFLSEAAAQFRFFKSGWRIRVAHARATYTEPEAIEALDHVRSFFETLATRLKEPSVFD
jgi:hypothetical protein